MILDLWLLFDRKSKIISESATAEFRFVALTTLAL